jgi:plasmid stability protein
MVAVTVRGIPDETHRAIKARAARNHRSTESEIRAILEDSAFPTHRVGLGSVLARAGRDAGFTDEDVEQILAVRCSAPAEPLSFK